MKKIFTTCLFTLLIAMMVALEANAQSTETRSVGSFHGIKSSQGISVYLHKGTTQSVKIEAENIDMDDVRTQVEGGILKISLGNGNHRNVNVKVDVTFVTLDMVAASSASGIFSSDLIQGANLEVMAASAATIELNVDVQQLMLNVSSASDIEIKGKAQRTMIEVSSAGEVDAYDLDAQQVTVMASSAGEAKVHAIQAIEAMASSGGSIKYKGDPQKSSTDSRSGGSVRKTN